MPSLIGSTVAANYRKTGPSTRFATRELVVAQIRVNSTDLTDETTSDNEDLFNGVTNQGQTAGTAYGNFAKAIDAIQTVGEIYAIGEPVLDVADSFFTVLLSADTLGDSNFTDNVNSGNMNADNGNATTIDAVLTALFGQSVSVTYTRLQGFGFN